MRERGRPAAAGPPRWARTEPGVVEQRADRASRHQGRRHGRRVVHTSAGPRRRRHRRRNRRSTWRPEPWRTADSASNTATASVRITQFARCGDGSHRSRLTKGEACSTLPPVSTCALDAAYAGLLIVAVLLALTAQGATVPHTHTGAGVGLFNRSTTSPSGDGGPRRFRHDAAVHRRGVRLALHIRALGPMRFVSATPSRARLRLALVRFRPGSSSTPWTRADTS